MGPALGAISLRRVSGRERWWFLFPKFVCDTTVCIRGSFGRTTRSSEDIEFQEWYLIRKLGPTIQLWWDVSEQSMEDAFLNGDLPGELLSKSIWGWKYRLLGSNLDAGEDRLLTGGYFVLKEDAGITAPATYVRFDSLPACAE